LCGAPTLLRDVWVHAHDLTNAQIVGLGQQFVDFAPKRQG